MTGAEKRKELRAARRAAGLCPCCGRPRLPGGKTKCDSCAESANRARAALRDKRRSKNKCVSCGSDELDSHRRCAACNAAACAAGRRRRGRLKDEGRCQGCGSDSDLETDTLCPACAERLRKCNARRKYQGLTWRPGKPGRPPKQGSA